MRTYITTKLQKLPQTIESTKTKLACVIQQADDLSKVKSAATSVRGLLQQIPEQLNTLDELESTSANLKDRHETAKAVAFATESNLRAMRDLLFEYQQLKDMHTRASNTSRQCEALEARMASEQSAEGSITTAGVLDMESIAANIISTQNKLKQLDVDRDKIQAELTDQANNRNRELQQKLAMQSQLSSLQMKAEKAIQLTNDIASKQQELTVTVNHTLPQLKQKAQLSATALNSKKDDLKNAVADFTSKQLQLSSETAELERSVTSCREAENRIREATEAKKATAQSRSHMDDLCKSKTELSNSLRAKRDEVRDKREELANRSAVLANLRANIDMKRKEQQLERLHEELNSITAEIGGKDPTTLKDAMQQKQSDLTEAAQQIARLSGLLESNAEWLRQHRSELSSAIYRDIDNKHSTALVDFAAHDMIAKDLASYHNALDKALMKFHSVKMAEINLCIKELWMDVHSSNDIDYVAIRSDTDEEAVSIPGAQGSRSYNYRLVMVKEGVELEMRGRCSAGQKVLASLIVRLALAETFCISCGILALDEPTTNLDRCNIENLAKALRNLIESKRGNRNFQLLLITHDEDFVRTLARLGMCDHYFRVGKNEQGHSTVKAVDIRGY
eukprot:GHVQ01000846.1.p1 GENE.GHVQ01000846.1~~GHVQ01000846.1.p1  ORF type:complete len:622 (-),score=122.21 GHVQ01000846.1:68-1933(-)